MKTLPLVLSAVVVLSLAASSARSEQASGFLRFSEVTIGGGPNGAVTLAGGGRFDPASGFVKMSGQFRCTADIAQGPLGGCRAGEGVRWQAVELLPSSLFKCSGDPNEPLITVVSDDDTAVINVEFFREGDGNTPSFTTKVFVSAVDEAPELPGIQSAWILGVGCGEVDLR